MQTLRDIAPYLALAAAALALVLLALVLVLWARVRRLRRAQGVVLGRHGERDLVAHAESLESQVRNLRDAVEILTDELDEQMRQLDHALTNRAIVRYDAFRDAGGEQSASFALLDQYRSGVVLSAIAARDFARIYVKHLTEGVADRDLSPEERQAVAAAVPRPLTPGEAGRSAARAALPDVGPRPGGGAVVGTGGEAAASDAGADRGGDAAGPDESEGVGMEPAVPEPGAPAASLPADTTAMPPAGAGPEPAALGAEAGQHPGLEAEATYASGPAEPETPRDEVPVDRPGPESPTPLQPLLDDDAFTWDEPPARPAAAEGAPDVGAAAQAGDATAADDDATSPGSDRAAGPS